MLASFDTNPLDWTVVRLAVVCLCVVKQAGEQQVLPARGVLQLLALRGVAEILQVGGQVGGAII